MNQVTDTKEKPSRVPVKVPTEFQNDCIHVSQQEMRHNGKIHEIPWCVKWNKQCLGWQGNPEAMIYREGGICTDYRSELAEDAYKDLCLPKCVGLGYCRFVRGFCLRLWNYLQAHPNVGPELEARGYGIREDLKKK